MGFHLVAMVGKLGLTKVVKRQLYTKGEVIHKQCNNTEYTK
jgi:hypothetical protein